MKIKKGKLGYSIISSAIVWGLVIIGCSFKLKGTPYYNEISPILIGGTIFHLLFIWGPMAAQFKKTKSAEDNGEN